MANPSTSNLNQWAVLWPFVGYDRYGQPLVSDTPEEIACTWNDRKSESLDPQGNTITIDATAFVDRDLKEQSNIWHGRLADLFPNVDDPSQPLPEGLEIMQVIGFNSTPNIKGRFPTREVKLMRYRDSVPEYVPPPPPPPPPPFVPSSLTGLLMWLKQGQGAFQDTAGTVPATADGDPVRRRNSLIGASYVTAAAGCVLKKSVLNGADSIRYNGTVLNGFLASGFSLANAQACTVFFAHRCTKRGSPISGSGNGLFQPGPSNYFWVGNCVFHTNRIGGQGGPGPSDEDQEVLVLTSSPSGMVWYENGVQTFSSADTLPAGPTTQLNFGGFNAAETGGYPFNGDEYESGVYDRVLSVSELSQLHTYLLAAYPPYSAGTDKPLLVFDGNSIVAGVNATANANEYPIITVATLGAGSYYRKNLGFPGGTTTGLTTLAPSRVDSLYSAARSKNVVLFHEISNDLVQNGATGAAAFANIKAYCTTRKAAGWRVIILDCLPRQNMNAGQEANRVTCNNLLAADFTGTTANPRIFTPAGGVIYADLLVRVSQIANLSDPTNATYYADGTHLTDAGNALIAADVAVGIPLV